MDEAGAATTTVTEPGRQQTTSVTDPNGRTTRMTYDVLGRMLSVRLPGDDFDVKTFKYDGVGQGAVGGADGERIRRRGRRR